MGATEMDAGVLARQTTVRIRTRLPAMAFFALLFLQLISPHRVWILLLCALGIVLTLSWVWARSLARSVAISRELVHGMAQAGEAVEESFRLYNDGLFPVLWARTTDASDMPGYPKEQVLIVSTASAYRWSVRVVCRRRGLYTLGPTTLHMQDPFGFYDVMLRDNETNKVLVTPPVVDLPAMILPRGLAAGRVVVRQPAADLTQTISATRPYVRGDPWRHIHWASSAHSGVLMSKTFQAEVSGDLWIVLDLDGRVQAGAAEESTVEYAVTLASSLAERLLQENRAVGLVASGQEPEHIPPARGEGQLWRLLQALALVNPGGSAGFSTVLKEVRSALQLQTTLMVITPSSDPTWVEALGPLVRRGAVPTALLLDAASFGGDGDLRAVRIAVAQLGIPHHVVAKGFPFHRVRKKQVPQASVVEIPDAEGRSLSTWQGAEERP